ncbi:lasso peptide biosynthesis B2 protein [Caulobacter sp. UNC279MFTsu5.1]|uniref:lasso peptide biosynthesis B2 protein n=1 Tax=Caulobacter sp. UNC279MFTsu5.1 TaxID=1502775 RepID=UPI0008F2DB16|nr:lasso peptide biosynthesis B2 protein [Caulobacter sp. UNC279MFTsu5.1]SFI51864.1 Transglutaminase-like superfamily protein [Caulobacter sp. UNC279MFTsu5.1]
MRLWLAPHVFAVTIGPDIVVLDVLSDTYFCLADAALHLRLGADGAVDVEPAEAADDLLEAGLLQTAPPPPRAAAREIRQGRPSSPSPISPRAVGVALRANLTAAKSIDQLPFADVLSLAGPLAETVFEAPTTELLREADRFARLAPWLPREGLCLMRSLQQRLYLTRLGHAAAWVFGVRTWPFKAHCWLQAGDVVLDDTPEHVGTYTPILVV